MQSIGRTAMAVLASVFCALMISMFFHGGKKAVAQTLETVLTIVATSPHVADGIDRSLITATVATESSFPITNTDVALEIGPPVFVNQLTHYIAHLDARNLGGGRYTEFFVSPHFGPFMVVGADRINLSRANTLVDFVPPIDSTAEDLGARLTSSEIGIDDAESDNCKAYFAKLDDEFYPPILVRRIAAETDAAKRAMLMERLADLNKALAAIDANIKLEADMADGRDATASQADFNTKKAAARDAVNRLSASQLDVMKQFFGNAIDFGKYQKCTELFNNFDLVPKFDEAIERINKAKQMRMDIMNETDPVKKADLIRMYREFVANGTVVRGPDSAIAHVRWAKFAHIALDLGFQIDTWRNLKPILAKGSAITVAVLDKTKTMQQTAAQIDAIRAMYDPLKPKDTDTEDEKKRKIDEVEKKLLLLVKAILIDKKVIAQLPGFDSNSTLRTTVTSSFCANGNEANLGNLVTNAISLQTTNTDTFGFGADHLGQSYVLVGTTQTGQTQFAVGGFGLTPAVGQGLAAYQGSTSGNVTIGTVDGILSGVVGGKPDECVWSGTFEIRPRLVCDVDGNGSVDRNDLSVVFGAHNTAATAGDPRDADGDGTITVNDVRFCTVRCAKSNCVP
jgi:hypothetical protein